MRLPELEITYIISVRDLDVFGREKTKRVQWAYKKTHSDAVSEKPHSAGNADVSSALIAKHEMFL